MSLLEDKDFDSALLALYRNLDFSSNLIDTQLALITKACSEMLDVDRVGVWLYENEKQTIHCSCLYLNESQSVEKDIRLNRSDFEPYFQALEKDLNIEAHVAQEHPATSCFTESYLKPLNILSMYDTPIWRADSVIGVLCMEYKTPIEKWENHEKAFARNIADLTAKVIERYSVMDLLQTLEENNQDLESSIQKRTSELKHTLDDLQSTQERMVIQEKLASLGSLTAGIAHEIKNPLSLITNAADALPFLIESLENSKNVDDQADQLEQIKELVRIVTTHSHRTNKIVNNMLTQVNDSDQKTEDYDFSLSCTQAAELAKRSLWAKYAQDIEFDFNIEPHIYVNHCSQDITRIFSNSFQNSAHSLAEKHQKQKGFKAIISVNLKKLDDHVLLCIQDNGCGIPKEIEKDVLTPFFTTKDPEEGTGLGLSMMNDLIKSIQGSLEINSQEGKFTELKILLPLIQTSSK